MEGLIKRIRQERTGLENKARALSGIINKERLYQEKGGSRIQSVLERLRVGNLVQGNFSFPALLPSRGISGFAVELDNVNQSAANALVEMLVLQILCVMETPYRQMTVIDPEHLGLDFRHLIRLQGAIVERDAIRERISSLYADSVRVVNNCLTGYKDIDEYNSRSGSVQPYSLIVYGGFSPENAEELHKFSAVVENAAETGTIIIMTFRRNADSQEKRRLMEKILSKMIVLGTEGFGGRIRVGNLSSGPDQFFNRLYAVIQDTEERTNAWLEKMTGILHSENANALLDDVRSGIRVPVGKCGGKEFCFTLGQGVVANSCFVGGQSGMGKTVFLNTLIARAMQKYTPDEVQFVLMNCAGAGYGEYEGSPHVLKLIRSSDTTVLMEGIDFLDDEIKRREELLKVTNTKDIRSYIDKTGRPLPWILCIVDEVHILFGGRPRDVERVETVLIKEVNRIGRKYGMCFIGCTQSLDGGMKSSYLDNIPVRVALGMTPNQSEKILSVRNHAAVNLVRGEAVVNYRNGAVDANNIVKIDYLTQNEIDTIVNRCREQFS